MILFPVLFILDFDDTLVTRTSPRTFIEHDAPNLLETLIHHDVHLCIASRNPPYIVIQALKDLKVLNFFTKIIADYRPKKYQVMHAWYELRSKKRTHVKTIVFLDDHADNCLNVKEVSKKLAAKGVQLFSIVHDPEKSATLEIITNAIIKNDFKTLESMSENQCARRR